MTTSADIRSQILLWLRRGGLLILSIVVVEYLVLPQLIGASDDISLLASAQPGLLAVALALEACSLACFTALTRATLPVGCPRFWTLIRIDLTGYGVSHVMPGGGATAAAFRYRLLTRAGVSGEDAFAGATVQTAAALVMLIGLFFSGIVLSLQTTALQSSYVVAGSVALGLLLALAVVAFLLTTREEQTLARVHRLASRLSAGGAAGLERAVSGLAHHLDILAHDKVLLTRTVGWAVTNWLLDAACLWFCLRAYGFSGPVGPLLALYGAVNLLAMLPITPGGLGVVEGVLIPAVVALGAGAPVALLGVLTWRLLQYWLPIPLAALTYGSLRLGVLRHVRSRVHASGARPCDPHR